MPELQVHSIDLLVLMVYVVGTRVLCGWYFARKIRGGGPEDYFLADRSLGWPVIGLSFFVSNMSGSTFVGLPGAGYADGIAVFLYEWLPALILILILFILILSGVMATALYADLERPDFVFPALAFDVLPVGLRGLMLAALAAAILSSLEAILNSASTLFTVDFVKTLRPHTGDRSLVWIGRWATVGLMVLAVLWTPVILTFPTLWQYLQSILAYVTPPIVAAFLAGIFWRRANARGAFLTIVTGVPLGVLAWLGNEIFHVTSIQFLYGSGIMFVVSAAILMAAVATGPPPDARKVRRNTWTPQLWRRDTEELRGVAWYANHRVLAALLSTLSLALVAWWW